MCVPTSELVTVMGVALPAGGRAGRGCRYLILTLIIDYPFGLALGLLGLRGWRRGLGGVRQLAHFVQQQGPSGVALVPHGRLHACECVSNCACV